VEKLAEIRQVILICGKVINGFDAIESVEDILPPPDIAWMNRAFAGYISAFPLNGRFFEAVENRYFAAAPIKASTVCEPIKPAPPVTRTRMELLSLIKG